PARQAARDSGVASVRGIAADDRPGRGCKAVHEWSGRTTSLPLRGGRKSGECLLVLLQLLPLDDVRKGGRTALRIAGRSAGLAQRRKGVDRGAANVRGNADRRLDGDRNAEIVQRCDLIVVEKVVEQRDVADVDGDE